MKREFLEELGLTKEVIDKIMNENGSDIENARKKSEAERDNYKNQLETAQKALKEFEGIDVKDLQEKVKNLNTDLANKETEYQQKIAEIEFNTLLDGAISKSGAKNSKAVKGLLDLKSLQESKNQAEDIKKALETVKSENDYMFASDEPFKNVVKETNGASPEIDKESFAKMGYRERLKLKKENPEKYNELKGD